MAFFALHLKHGLATNGKMSQKLFSHCLLGSYEVNCLFSKYFKMSQKVFKGKTLKFANACNPKVSLLQ